MKMRHCSIILFCIIMAAAPRIFATNGDNLIGVGPNARSMGGVGVASPLDAISSVFANPAAMCFGPYCPTSQFDFSGTLFMPKVEAKIENSQGTFKAKSEDYVYSIPAIGFSVPIGESASNWRFGLAAYGVTGLGVDYRDTDIDQPRFYSLPFPSPNDAAPLATGEFASLQIMKFAPAVAFQPNVKLSLGLAFHINYGILDLRNGASPGYAFGLQPGIIYKPNMNWSLGATYTSPQPITHKNVNDFDNDGRSDDLDLESPQQLGFGVAYDFIEPGLLIEADVKWLNWSDADGYKDFGWDDQWVFAVGAQYNATQKLKLRAGYNYAKNPIKKNDNFNGTASIDVQGKTLSSEYYYETFRLIGFPGIVEHHLTFGAGYQFTERFIFDLGFMYGFENSMKESGTDLFGQPVTIESRLSETSIDFGLTYRF